ncbi:thioesterase family protein [Marinactinospora thermotolerans]|uniref:Acyl-CoA thioesterase n=1 Tax=Marinactinospora thermotolerans DSM 45154 TaxID=1122192 RepID=A0A1T4Q658_9ACTN|nr:thioesterase family protein [Marinactinospora thermotolerans]SJZ99011.1 Acyl-CoA thioesterase [Marinactinospora thermotolerans DSM 45154]
MTRFDSATAVTRTGDGHYTAELDPGYLIGSALNGGYLMAVLQRAALAESTHPHAVSSSYHFLRPGAPGPADIELAVRKTGRTVTTVQVTLSQAGKELVTGLVATATLDPAATPRHETARADIPPIERCHRFDPRADRSADMGFPDRVDQFYAPRTYAALSGSDPAAEPEITGHLAPSEADGGAVEDPSLFLPLAVDALPPVVTVLDSWRWAPTVELTWHMRAVPEPGPLAFRSRADLVSDGWFDETVDLWDVKGRLVAQSRQLARIGR